MFSKEVKLKDNTVKEKDDKDENFTIKKIPKIISKDEVSEIIENYLITNKFQHNIHSLIYSTLTSKNSSTLSREQLTTKIMDNCYLKNAEKEILNNLFKKFNFEVAEEVFINSSYRYYNENDIISTNLKNNSLVNSVIKNKNANNSSLIGKEPIEVLIGNNTESILPPINFQSNNNYNLDEIQHSMVISNKKEIDNYKLLDYLIEEIIISSLTNNNIESLFLDLNNFKQDLLLKHPKLDEVVKKISDYLFLSASSDNFHNSILNFLVEKISDTKEPTLLINLACGYMSFLYILTKKFFTSQFDISKFYKLYFNVQTLNSIIVKFYGELFISRKIPDELIKKFINLFFKIILHNYNNFNSVYIMKEEKKEEKKEKEKEETEKQNLEDDNIILINQNKDSLELANKIKYEFGISTNYILMILFCIDPDLCSFKILFRQVALRKIILENFELYKYLPFIDYEISKASFQKKYCFLWKHFNILDEIVANSIKCSNERISNEKILLNESKLENKVSKKFLLYSWFSIKINFLGLIIRYRKIREKYFDYFGSKSSIFNCYNLFINLIKFLLQVLFVDKTELILNQNLKKEGSPQKVSAKISNKIQITGFEFILFEEWQKEKIIHLCKEVLCDFVLYCDNKDCVSKKKKYLEESLSNPIYSQDLTFCSVVEDIELAINEVSL